MKKQVKKTKKQESGRSMVEMVGVLAVMGLITAAAFVLITSALKTQKMSRLEDEVNMMVNGVRTLYATTVESGGSCTVITASTAANSAGAGLAEAVGAPASNPFGGVYGMGITAECQPQVMITGLGEAKCAGLQNKAWGSVSSGAGTCSKGTLTVTFTAKADGTGGKQ